METYVTFKCTSERLLQKKCKLNRAGLGFWVIITAILIQETYKNGYTTESNEAISIEYKNL